MHYKHRDEWTRAEEKNTKINLNYFATYTTRVRLVLFRRFFFFLFYFRRGFFLLVFVDLPSQIVPRSLLFLFSSSPHKPVVRIVASVCVFYFFFVSARFSVLTHDPRFRSDCNWLVLTGHFRRHNNNNNNAYTRINARARSHTHTYVYTSMI